ncbi:hypothetical protein [Vibrio alginolyticus]|uniref:hypothetical protein n=1 Tax=Vibrio alginolyticus TaxID=663 RepID=UPI0006CA84F9|nr:hypothetical protein [Vibrio alginolyticus]KPM95044.1 hypothetical protein AOG25_26490 [Vibrio alginolyticus]
MKHSKKAATLIRTLTFITPFLLLAPVVVDNTGIKKSAFSSKSLNQDAFWSVKPFSTVDNVVDGHIAAYIEKSR